MIGAGGFDSPELRAPVRREGALWAMSRIITAGIALARSGVEEDCVRALVIEDVMDEDLAGRFVKRFRPSVSAMAEALENAEDPEELADLFAAALSRQEGGGE